jgi:ElaB/YqjD/DUF883 family membrane-anchored ribosome-binding protein
MEFTTMRNTKTHKSEFLSAASHTRDGVFYMGDAAKGMARDQVQRLQDEMVSLRDTVVAKIEERPVKSLLIALGAGLLLGLFVGRR